MSARQRVCVGVAVSGATGALARVFNAPDWMLFLAVAILCLTVLPWIALGGDS